MRRADEVVPEMSRTLQDPISHCRVQLDHSPPTAASAFPQAGAAKDPVAGRAPVRSVTGSREGDR
jgi:hypothetical protein